MVNAATERTRGVARGGAFALFGAIISAVAGFALTLVLGQTLGAQGVGVVMQAIGAFTIALSVGRAGLDTTAVWLLPRVADSDRGEVRAAVSGLLTLSATTGISAAVALWAIAPLFAESTPALAEAIRLISWALPFATLMMVGLAATRGLGGVRPYVAIGSIAVPGVRPLLVWGFVLAGGGAVTASLVWALPLPVAALVCLIILRSLVQRAEPTRGSSLPSRSLLGRIARYALPRSIASILEQVLQWLDVLIVGYLAGPVAAGVYGAATRLVSTGMMLSASLRIVVAPHYSRLLGRRDLEGVRSLYTVTTTWIIFFSSPIFLTFIAFGGTVLSVFGPEFRTGGVALMALGCGLLMVLMAGNIQSVLLMSGYSGRAAANKVAAVVVNIVGLFLLVPAYGIVGAALSWCTAMLVDTALAAWQVQRLVGVRVLPAQAALGAIVAVLSYGTTALVARLVLGDTWPGLLVGCAAGAGVWLLAGVSLRHRLSLNSLGSLLSPPPAPERST